MTIKRMLLLASMALAAIAFAAPAVAQADEFWTETTNEAGEVVGEHTVGLGTKNADPVEFTGSLSSTASGGAVKNGPCEVHALVDVWNEHFGEPPNTFITGTAKVTNFEITTPCHVTLLGNTISPTCQIEEAKSDTSTPWHVTVLAETEIAIHGANFTNVYTQPACSEFGIPPEASASGTATATAENRTNEVCLVFNNSGHLEDAEGNPVTIDGEVCAPHLTLK